MADTEQVIRLAGNEDIHTVRALLAHAEAKRVMLVVPRQHPAFQRVVRLKLLARQAAEEGVQLALITRDSEIRDLAQQLKLPTFRSVEVGRRARRWDEGREVTSGRFNSLPIADPGIPTRHRGRGVILERRQQLIGESNWGEHVILAGLLFGMMVLLAATLVLLVPSAYVTLVPDQVPIEATLPVIVDPASREVDVFNAVVPADVLNVPVQGVQDIATSGRKDLPAGRAVGEVLFLNVTGEPITIPANTIVSTTSGVPVRFRTTSDVLLPGEVNARTSASIEAISPGPSGNVRPLQINLVEGAAASSVRVLNENPTEGGDVQQRAVVTASDKEMLFGQLRQHLLNQGRAELERRLQEENESPNSAIDRFIVPGTVTIKITAETYSASVDDQADVLTLDLRARVSAIVVSQGDIERLGRRALRDHVPAGYRMLDDGFHVVWGEAQGEDMLELPVRATGIVGAQLSEEEIRALVRGQPVDEARAALLHQLSLAADPAVDLSPDWWDRMPYLPFRIFIRVGVLDAE
ncbi:MAG: baseplate J/gp47 family protein [Chloroflexota bacterium]|nr:baseplate J/gp47 family protein [Chloroflexota bacterium]